MVTKNKTPAEVEAVTITMSRETAQAVKQACEEYLRFRMGQFEDFTPVRACVARLPGGWTVGRFL